LSVPHLELPKSSYGDNNNSHFKSPCTLRPASPVNLKYVSSDRARSDVFSQPVCLMNVCGRAPTLQSAGGLAHPPHSRTGPPEPLDFISRPNLQLGALNVIIFRGTRVHWYFDQNQGSLRLETPEWLRAATLPRSPSSRTYTHVYLVDVYARAPAIQNDGKLAWPMNLRTGAPESFSSFLHPDLPK
jgi:hypothetical protein